MTQPDNHVIRNRLLATVALSALMCGSAMADPAPAVFDWSGPYAGLNLGFMSANSKVHENDDSDGYLDVFGGASANNSSVLGGGQFGYNWQFGQIVLGAEGDLDFTGTNASGGNGGPLVGKEPATLAINAKISELATLRARLGYAFAPVPVLVYATAGVAFGDVSNSFNSSWYGAPTDGSGGGWRGGWTAGGGVEYAFAPHWTVRAEGLYIDLGSATVASGNPAKNYDHYIFNFHDTAVIGRAALNYKF